MEQLELFGTDDLQPVSVWLKAWLEAISVSPEHIRAQVGTGHAAIGRKLKTLSKRRTGSTVAVGKLIQIGGSGVSSRRDFRKL